MRQLKQLKGNTTNSKTWAYSPLKIPANEITAMRLGVYDNEPNLAPGYAAGRYRAEVQIWTNNNCSKQCDYKIVTKLTNYDGFRQNKYKKAGDPHLQWYVDDCELAKELNLEHGTYAEVLHGALGSKYQANNYRHVPQWTVSVMFDRTNQLWIGQVRFEDYEQGFELDQITMAGTAELRYKFERF